MRDFKLYALLALAVTAFSTGLSTPTYAQYGYDGYYAQVPSWRRQAQTYYGQSFANPFYGPRFGSGLGLMSPPVWNLSAAGGYYDQTGQIKVVVPGSELWRYGGTFFNGNPVPTGPVPTNGAGHVLY